MSDLELLLAKVTGERDALRVGIESLKEAYLASQKCSAHEPEEPCFNCIRCLRLRVARRP